MSSLTAPISLVAQGRPPSVARIVARGVLLAALALVAFLSVRRALSISLPADVGCAALSIALLAWGAIDLGRRLAARPAPPAGRRGRRLSLRPAVAGWALLVPMAGWLALRVPGPMGEGPVAVPFDRAPFGHGPWHEGPVLLVSLGDSIGTGYGVAPGRGYFDLLAKNDPSRHPDVGRADLSTVLPGLSRQKLASLSTNSIAHEADVAFIRPPSLDAIGVVCVTSGGIDLIHPYGHGEPREGAMYGATLAQAAPWVERFEARLDRMLVAIAGRFPAGCEVFVATIYDPTDGVGDIEHATVIGWLSPWPDGLAILARFNAAIRAACARHPFAHVVDVREVMLGHGIHCREPSSPHYRRDDPTYWYWWNLEDPNERGYDAIRRAFLAELGAVLPARFAARSEAAATPPR